MTLLAEDTGDAILFFWIVLCQSLAWTNAPTLQQHLIGNFRLRCAMPRDLKQLVKTPDLAEQYANAFGKEEKLKQARAYTCITHFDRNTTSYIFAGHT